MSTKKKGQNGRRLDRNRIILRKGETQRKDCTYDYRWTTLDGERNAVYAKTLEELREKEDAIYNDEKDGIGLSVQRITVNDIFELWCDLKMGL